jgi:hypothetical protein
LQVRGPEGAKRCAASDLPDSLMLNPSYELTADEETPC